MTQRQREISPNAMELFLAISMHLNRNDRSSGSACHPVQPVDLRGLVQVIPPAERAKAVSLTTSGMYLGSAAAMLVLPRVVQIAGPASIFRLVGLLALLWLLLWRLLAPGPTARCCLFAVFCSWLFEASQTDRTWAIRIRKVCQSGTT